VRDKNPLMARRAAEKQTVLGLNTYYPQVTPSGVNGGGLISQILKPQGLFHGAFALRRRNKTTAHPMRFRKLFR
jgi:hypothetical protein